MRNLDILIKLDLHSHLDSMMGIERNKFNIINESSDLDGIPQVCPICNRSLKPKAKGFYFIGSNYNGDIEVIFHCDLPNCGKLFLSKYQYVKPLKMEPEKWRYINSYPQNPIPIDFDNKDFKLSEISPMFVGVFNQANAAETLGLKDIAGVGYRRALEFLIKDYLINYMKKDEKIIKGKFLGTCIKEDIEDESIKRLAERAAWLGNDETHYERKWDKMDIEDLKKLINLTVRNIESKVVGDRYLNDMNNRR